MTAEQGKLLIDLFIEEDEICAACGCGLKEHVDRKYCPDALETAATFTRWIVPDGGSEPHGGNE